MPELDGARRHEDLWRVHLHRARCASDGEPIPRRPRRACVAGSTTWTRQPWGEGRGGGCGRGVGEADVEGGGLVPGMG
jgi:hypothetical protein